MSENNFNSIKVQLKPHLMYENDEDWEFQFHKGTIKTTCKYLCGNVSTNFNSIKVQLKP